jgi:8-oxo-dGTP pyrophosphatase MutT (NUDIX family)
MAFPGGRWSPGDPDLLTTAIRETGEEVGVELHPGEMIGVLDDIAPRTPSLPPVIVRPFVFALSARQPLSLNHEVATASWVELARLEQSGIYRPFEFSAGGAHLLLPGYHLEEGVVWGMTERILTPLLSLIRSADRDTKNVR